MADSTSVLPRIAVIGAGIFARTQYIPRLREIADIVVVKAFWSRSEASAKAAVELARDFAPEIECKWGDSGLDDIINDQSILGVAIVLAGQVQVEISLKMLKAGKHVIQEKPAAGSVAEAEIALSYYNSLNNISLTKPIWALAENYRFEPAFVESGKLVKEIGEMMNIQVIVEGSMNSSNPYFSSTWRRNFFGGFILDMGVHFVAGLRMLVGCEIASVSSIARHVDETLPPPDNLCSLFKLENGCAGVFLFAVNSRSPKILWRVDGTKGAVEVERSVDRGKHGYMVSYFSENGECTKTFHPFCGVNEELKAFVHDILHASKGETVDYKPEPRYLYVEGARDVAVLEAMLESSSKEGASVLVKNF
ncbi:Oxidoreductase family, NAD-binding Rossmann fold [Carex littledalei]|uniref:Oxidoreductase family, NAD-binding Rossmann fold n=1 Tax=Carex littledalei TaxID=544730 RepID=A0A833VJT9_9POAL|nr:Oxidoreductase family, NAD-binding Rossmann fold [Carex littledalei]